MRSPIVKVSVALCVCALLGGAAMAAAARPRGATTVRVRGRIGRLRIDRASKVRVIAVLGAPAAEGWGNVMTGYPDYESLGYSCRPTDVPALFPVGDPESPAAYCRTVYLVNEETGRLSAFFTADPSYRGPRGIHPGMRAAKAERRLHRKAFVGCGTGIELHPKHGRAYLLVGIAGGHLVQKRQPILRGGRISSFSLESDRHPVGLTFC